MKKLFYLIFFLLAACQKEELESDFIVKTPQLTKKSEIIMRALTKDFAGEDNWNFICEKGELLQEEAIAAYNNEYGSHYVIPVVVEHRIQGVVFLPLEIKKSNSEPLISVKKIIFIEKQFFNCELSTRLFFESKGFELWQKKGLFLDMELVSVQDLTNKKNNREKLFIKSTRSIGLTSTFGWDIYITTDKPAVFPDEVENAIMQVYKSDIARGNGSTYISSLSFSGGQIGLAITHLYDELICCELYGYIDIILEAIDYYLNEAGYFVTFTPSFDDFCIHNSGGGWFPGGGGTGGEVNPGTGAGSNPGSSGGGGGGGSGGGTTPDIQDGPNPVYPTLTVPTSIPIQLPNLCLTSSMVVANAILGGNINEGVYTLDYWKTYGIPIGVGDLAPSISNVPTFVNRHFQTTPFISYSEAMRNNYLILADVPSNIPNSCHCVVVVGYKGNNYLLILDPDTGSQRTVSASSVGQYVRIVITGTKN